MDQYIREGCQIYANRLTHYAPFEIIFLPETKLSRSMPNQKLREAESEIFLKTVKSSHFLVLLDESGKQFTSIEFSKFIETAQNNSRSDLVFAIGGAYGFDEKLKKRADAIVSLSSLTFPHQLTRLIFLEQLYRAFTIIKKEPYHHI